MKRLLIIVAILLFSLSAGTVCAQKKTKPTFETMYRPVYGYLLDTLTHVPMRDVKVYVFDFAEDAVLGKEALAKSRNPMNLKLKGDVAETRTDETGRYMIPARSNGVLVFYLPETGSVLSEEIMGRSEVSMGRQKPERTMDHDITDLLGKDYRRSSGKSRPKDAEGVVLDMDFKAYIPQPGDRAKISRVAVERRLIDMETGEILSSTFPAVRDGKRLHKQRRKMIAKGDIADTLYAVADCFPFLSDTTSSVKVTDRVDTEMWKDRCFRLGYFVSMETDEEEKMLDTLYMMTNRVDKPLKYLEYDLDPYMWEVEETTEQRRAAVSRRLVLEGEFDGRVPEVLKDPSYVLRELHLKASVVQDRPYGECIALADSMLSEAMGDIRSAFGGKLNDNVRVTKISQVTNEVAGVEYRYVLSTGRQFSKNEYLTQFRRAKDDASLEELCRRAIEESTILEGEPWDYAANLLAAAHIRQARPDISILAPFTDQPERVEMLANQVLMYMLDGDFAGAASLAERLPDSYASLRELTMCRVGKVPADEESVRLLAESSQRNEVLMDMLSDKVDESTLEVLASMPEDDAFTWYLKARAHCIMNPDEFYADKYVVECLGKCFEIDEGMEAVAKFDSRISEYALKEVLGVFVL